jgi:hypothetical protein
VQFHCSSVEAHKCDAARDGIRTREDQLVTHVYDTNGKISFDARRNYIRYFPIGLSKFLPNLIDIFIENGPLEEIHGEDLAPFPQLMNLYLSNNKIKVLERNLFSQNQQLQLVFLNDNPIIYVDPSVFDHLPNLRFLGMKGNSCISRTVENNRMLVTMMIHSVYAVCTDSHDALVYYENLAQTYRHEIYGLIRK